MLNHISIGIAPLQKAKAFYDATLSALGYRTRATCRQHFSPSRRRSPVPLSQFICLKAFVSAAERAACVPNAGSLLPIGVETPE
jgi:hypothetical protein